MLEFEKPSVDFLVIGAMKCATSTICAYLEDHPEVYMAPKVDPNYFSHDKNYRQGESHYATYFTERKNELVSGEGSNYYSARALFPNTAARIAGFNSEMKIIYMVRNPLDRIISAWVQNRVDHGDEVPPSPDEAILRMPDLFVGQSLYWNNLEPFRDRFPEENIFVGFMEDLQSNPNALLADLCAFLDVSEAPICRTHQNKRSSKKVPGRLYSAINKGSLSSKIKSVVPKALRSAVKAHALSISAEKAPKLSSDTKSKVLDVLEPDAKRFLNHYGKPANYWRY